MFPTTRWSLVARAGGDPADSEPGRALEELCTAYWEPLYRFARREGASAEDARDLVQGLFERLLARHDLGTVRADRGRFRSWLLAAFRHHAADERDRARAAKRWGGRVKIADFGLAKLLRPDPREPGLTVTRTAIGTPHYMAPEQFERPETVDARADVYAAAVVLYELLTGTLPAGRPALSLIVAVCLGSATWHSAAWLGTIRMEPSDLGIPLPTPGTTVTRGPERVPELAAVAGEIEAAVSS